MYYVGQYAAVGLVSVIFACWSFVGLTVFLGLFFFQTHKLRQFIEQQMPGPVSPSMVDLILFPEVIYISLVMTMK